MVILSGIDRYLGLIIIGGLLAFFGLIIIIVIQVKKHVNAFKIEKPEISEEQAAKEELDMLVEGKSKYNCFSKIVYETPTKTIKNTVEHSA